MDVQFEYKGQMITGFVRRHNHKNNTISVVIPSLSKTGSRVFRRVSKYQIVENPNEEYLKRKEIYLATKNLRQESTREALQTYSIGQTVHFFDPKCGIRTGNVIKINRIRLSVLCGTLRFHVPIGSLRVKPEEKKKEQEETKALPFPVSTTPLPEIAVLRIEIPKIPVVEPTPSSSKVDWTHSISAKDLLTANFK